MKKIFSWTGRVVLPCLVALLIGSPVFAALELTLGNIYQADGKTALNKTDLLDVTKNRIESFYFNPAGTDPTLVSASRLLIATNHDEYDRNPSSTLADYSDFLKYKGYITSLQKYWFMRYDDPASPGAIIYIRVWDGPANTEDSYYSAVQSFGNDYASQTSLTLNVSTLYKAAAPDKPLIDKFEETATTLNDANRTKSSTLKVYGAIPAATDGLREVPHAAWKMWLDGVNEPRNDEANDLTKSIDANLTLNADQVAIGQTYRFKVGHQNWFSYQAGLETDDANYIWSDTAYYMVAGSGGAGAPVTITLNLQRPNNTGGLNTFAFPFDSTKDITVSTAAGFTETVRIVTIGDLIGSLNRATGNLLSTFGYFDSTNQQPAGFTSMLYANKVLDLVNSKTMLSPNQTLDQFLALPVEEANISDRCFSIGVIGNATITMTGYLR